ncbi:carboxypeptidase-like regulatory domain-containing protein [Flavobacterium longum]|uniref:carboxypeptidase-like regulatory domain-containing protein n=1 Tax=Flavobacterium longum TaxID=1299340 RepID=UPI0039ECADDB
MPIVEKGRFCEQCQKNLTDFTTWSDRQILERMTASGKICGRFSGTQLNRELVAKQEKHRVWTLAATTVFAILGHETTVAQAQPKIEKTDAMLSNEAARQDTIARQRRVSGIVSENGLPVPGVNVVIKDKNIGTQTDLDGRYAIEAQTGDVLVFSFIGLNDIVVTVKQADSYDVEMESNGIALLGEVVFARKRNLFGRVSTWIGNLFRSKENKKSIAFRHH